MEQVTSPLIHPSKKNDSRLLMERIRQSLFDDAGEQFIRRCATSAKVCESLTEEELNELALVCQQHGLIQLSLDLLLRLNEKFPSFQPAWLLHCETLKMLDRKEDLLRVLAFARRTVPEDIVSSWPFYENRHAHSHGRESSDVDEPFMEMRHNEENIRIFMRLFRGRDDAFARQWVDKKDEKQGYVPVRHGLMPSDINEHLSGGKTYGIYLLNDNNHVHTGVIDVDLVKSLRQREEYRKNSTSIRRESIYLHSRILALAKEHGLTAIAEVSGGKGYHFWFPVAEPVEAAIMRKSLQQITAGLAEDVNCFHLEIFPKQDRLTGKGFGNLVKLPMGIHRGSGKPSWFVQAADRTMKSQFEYLRGMAPADPEVFGKLAGTHQNARVILHPRHAKWAEEYPELATLSARCAMIGQIIATARKGRTLSVREEKILLGTLAHLPRGRHLLHHICSELPEYNRPLLDYRMSRVRGTVLGCKRIHSLLEQHSGDLPCSFAVQGREYAHPLLHIETFKSGEPKSEKVENLKDALLCLQTAIRQVERFI